MKKLLKESGLRDIKKIAERYPKAEIYFHQDLDGVTTGIAMKKYLENQGFKVVDCEIIQYGEREWAIKNVSSKVMCDSMIEGIETTFKNYKPKKNFNL